MKRNKLYEIFHKSSKTSYRIISENNFTYFNAIRIINRYIKKEKEKNEKVLDIGCGVGSISFYLANKSFNVFGIDISRKAINIAKKTAKNLNLKSKTAFQKANIQDFLLKENYYDYVICLEILEHIGKDQLTINKIYKCLKTEGKIIISVPSKNTPLYKLGLTRKFDKKVGHLRRYSLEGLRKKLKIAGFDIEYQEKTEGVLRNLLFINNSLGKSIRFIRGPFVSVFMLIDKILITLFGESQIYLIGIKNKS